MAKERIQGIRRCLFELFGLVGVGCVLLELFEILGWETAVYLATNNIPLWHSCRHHGDYLSLDHAVAAINGIDRF